MLQPFGRGGLQNWHSIISFSSTIVLSRSLWYHHNKLFSMLYFHSLKLQICMEISLHAFHYYFNLRKFFRISFQSLHLISSYMIEWHLHCSHCSLLCTQMEYCKWKELYFMPCCMWKCHLFLQTTTESSIGILYSMTELMYFPFLCIVTERKFYNFFVF